MAAASGASDTHDADVDVHTDDSETVYDDVDNDADAEVDLDHLDSQMSEQVCTCKCSM